MLFSSGDELDSENSAFISNESDLLRSFLFGVFKLIIFTPKLEFEYNSLFVYVFILFILFKLFILFVFILLSLLILSSSFCLLSLIS